MIASKCEKCGTIGCNNNNLICNNKGLTLLKTQEIKYLEGVLIGLKICKEMWAQGTISHKNIYENEVYYKELLENAEKVQ